MIDLALIAARLQKTQAKPVLNKRETIALEIIKAMLTANGIAGDIHVYAETAAIGADALLERLRK